MIEFTQILNPLFLLDVVFYLFYLFILFYFYFFFCERIYIYFLRNIKKNISFLWEFLGIFGKGGSECSSTYTE